MKSLVPQIGQWLADRGAVFASKPVESLYMLSSTSWILTTPTSYDEITKGVTYYTSEARYLYITNDPKPFIPLDWVDAKVMVAEPAHWERALERITTEVVAVYVRCLEHVPQEDSPLPEHIQLRLNVMPEQEASPWT